MSIEGIETKMRIFAQEILDTTDIDSYGAPQQMVHRTRGTST
jgi:hypothetical protein